MKNKPPTDAELRILKVLWASGPSRLSDIRAALEKDRKVAATTLATMLKIMKTKGQVRRKSLSEGPVWEAAAPRARVEGGMLSKMIQGVFDGSAQKLVLNLVQGGQLTEADLKEVRQLLKKHPHSPSSKTGRKT